VSSVVVRSACVVVVVVGLLAACFVLDRAQDIRSGSLTGRVMHKTDAIAFPAVSVDGGHRLQRGGSDGTFAVNGLVDGTFTLRASVDEDGNGWPELATLVSVVIEETLHGNTTEPRLSGVLLDDVELSPTVEVNGVVRRADGTPAVGAIVTVLRDHERRSLAEASVGTDVDGAFRFSGLATGAARLVAVDDAAASVFVERALSAPLDDVILSLVDAEVPTVELAIVPAPADGTLVFVTLFSRGGAVDVEGPSQGGSVAVALPSFGPFDLFVIVDDADSKSGAIFSQVAAAPADDSDDLQGWGPVIVAAVDPCPIDGTPRDCDVDSQAGLPFLLGEPVLTTWSECVPACAGLVGTALQQARCVTNDGIVFDCDDDGDGQSDVTEPARCANRGSDFDGDGLCGVDDPMGQCASNDPAAADCRASNTGTARNPPARPEF
jgi:hypothetical protein